MIKILRLGSAVFGLLLFGLSPRAFATGLPFIWTTNADNTITILAYTGGPGFVTVPDTITGLNVTVIGPNAFGGKNNVTGVTLGTNVTTLSDYAFTGSGLINVTIPGGVSSIGIDVFSSCFNLSSVTIAQGVASIGTDMFSGCLNLASVTLPGSVTNIGDDAFQGAALSAITIPGSVSSIGSGAFSSCSLLNNVTIPGSVASIGLTAFESCLGLTTVTIMPGVANIGDYAFQDTGLTGIVIPGTVTNIGNHAFEICPSLVGATISPGVVSIGDFAFNSDPLASILIPGTVGNIGSYTFNNTKLTSVVVPSGVSNIGANAFADCNQLTNVLIAGTVAGIGASAFGACATLTNVTLAPGIGSIGDGAFASDPLNHITIPGSVTNIGSDAFNLCTNLINLFFSGNAPVTDPTAFSGDTGTIYYYSGTTGWSSPFAGLTAVALSLPSGSLQVTINPPLAVTAGAQWQVDDGSFQSNGATVNNLSIGVHVVGFSAVNGFFAPSNEMVMVAASETTVTNGTYLPEGALTVTLSPTAAVTAGTRWQVDGGGSQISGATVSNLVVGSHTVSFTAGSGWTNPPNQIVTISNGVTTMASGIYTPAAVPGDGLTLLTNGSGSIQHAAWPSRLTVGQTYTVKASPVSGNVFKNWVGGVGPLYSVLSTNASYTFPMQSNLVLEANFVVNPFLSVQGAYYGLFAPTNSARTQTNSGSFTFNLSSAGAASGKLLLGSETAVLIGKFGPDGSAVITATPRGGSALTVALQLDLADQMVTGTVSNGNFVADLTGFQAVFSARNKATAYQGKYTMIIPGTTNPAVGPYGTSYGTVTVGATGSIVFSGGLADGTAVSQSSVISADGLWPFYLPLYGGQGSLWSWNYFTNGTITNIAPFASWINATNASKTADYRSGFTNPAAGIIGDLYVSTNQPLLNMTNGLVALVGNGPAFVIFNQIALASNNKITFTNTTEDTNKLTLAINKTTGTISGSFANPVNPKQTIKVNGVLLQNKTDAQGYFLGTNQSGFFLLAPPKQ